MQWNNFVTNLVYLLDTEIRDLDMVYFEGGFQNHLFFMSKVFSCFGIREDFIKS